MTMDISNQNKLSEFYEELKRLNVNIIRPNINTCFADFRSDGKNFYYALGAIKNVGYEAVNNIVKERIENGEFKSINDFIERVNPKDINKLQLEGLVKSGAFDSIKNNRQALFNSIPNFILKSKNIFDNKIANQIDLFSSEETKNEDIVLKSDDWKFEVRLSKEFESVGFFISDHPLNQFKDIFSDYKIINYNEFNTPKEVTEANIAATILKIQEKKTQKGNAYAIIKLSDLASVFELFIFSDVLEMNREILVEGNSLMLTLIKNITDESNRFKRINVKKIISLKKLLDAPISNIVFNLSDINKITELSKKIQNTGNVDINIKVKKNGSLLTFKLKNKREINRKGVNLLKNIDILSDIN